MWILVFFSVVLSVFFYKSCIKPLSYWKNLGVPHTKGVPIFGSFFESILGKKHIFDILIDIHMEHKNDRYVGLTQFNKPMLMLNDVELIKKITIKDFDHFVDRMEFEDPDPFMRKNLLAMKGTTWKEMRATLSPIFTSAKIKHMSQLMMECAKNLQQSNQNTEGSTIHEVIIKDVFSKYSNDIIASVAFGIQCNSSADNGINTFYANAKKFTSFGILASLKLMFVISLPYLAKLFRISIFDKKMITYFTNIICDTMEYREKNNIIRPDLIHLLMEAKKEKLSSDSFNKDKEAGFAAVNESNILNSENRVRQEWTLEEITSQALLFFFAGFETVSIVSSFMAYELAINPDIQTTLQNEIDEVLERTNGDVKYDDIVKMKYMDQVLAETLRKWTAAFQSDRVCTKEYTIESSKPGEKDITLKPGDIILLPISAIHYDPEYFPDPEKFNPDRFSEENKHSIVSGTYIPFGIGPRNCIGSRFALLEVKILFCFLLSKINVVPTSKTQIPFKINPRLFNLSPSDMRLGFKQRNV